MSDSLIEIATRVAALPAAVPAVNERSGYTALEAGGGLAVIRTFGDLARPQMPRMEAAEILAKVKGE